MTQDDFISLGWDLVVEDKNSFILKKPLTDTTWYELFYCSEKNYIQIMEAVKGEKGEVKRYTKHDGDYDGMDFWV